MPITVVALPFRQNHKKLRAQKEDWTEKDSEEEHFDFRQPVSRSKPDGYPKRYYERNRLQQSVGPDCYPKTRYLEKLREHLLSPQTRVPRKAITSVPSPAPEVTVNLLSHILFFSSAPFAIDRDKRAAKRTPQAITTM